MAGETRCRSRVHHQWFVQGDQGGPSSIPLLCPLGPLDLRWSTLLPLLWWHFLQESRRFQQLSEIAIMLLGTRRGALMPSSYSLRSFSHPPTAMAACLAACRSIKRPNHSISCFRRIGVWPKAPSSGPGSSDVRALHHHSWWPPRQAVVRPFTCSMLTSGCITGRRTLIP